MSKLKIPVLAMQHIDPGLGRVEVSFPHGLTIDQIVRNVLPGANVDVLAQTRVNLSTPQGVTAIDAKFWTKVKPAPGVLVVVRVIAGRDALRSVLSVVVAIAAAASGAWVAGALGLAYGTVGYALVSAGVALGVTALGNLLINALIPPTGDDNTKRSYSISSTKNQIVPDGAVPVVLGTYRFAPPFAARPFTEIVDGDQFIRALFLVGEGKVQIDDIRIGETSISEFDEFEVETRSGLETDGPITLVPTQIVEDTVGVELTRPLPRDDAGEVIEDEGTVDKPVVRTTGKDASGASVIFAFKSGLVKFDGEDKRSRRVEIRIEQRLVTGEEWQAVETLEITAKKNWAFYRQHTWDFPSRGQWQVRLTMLTDESDSSTVIQDTTWVALQTIRPEYPLNYPRPLSLLAMRIKATDQLNGALDEVTVLASRIVPEWNAEADTWIDAVSSNPAALYRHVLQEPANIKAVTDSEIDLAKIQEWHEFCKDKGLTYNAVLASTDTILGDVLSQIAGAGRASREHDGMQWSVVIDNPTDDALVIDEISSRNAWGFKATRSYFNPPHAVIAKFNDADNNYKPTQRVVRWLGYGGEITETEAWDVPGKVHAAEVWREVYRRQLEAVHRPDAYQATQDGVLRQATRGDHVMVSSTALSGYHMSARVMRVVGNLIEIDASIEMPIGTSFAIRFRVFEDENDTIGTSIIRTIKYVSGETSVLTLVGSGLVPDVRELIHIGPSRQTSLRQIVRQVERTADHCSISYLVDAAPQIDTILDATAIPEFSSLIGEELEPNELQPSAPRFTSVSSGISGAGTPNLVSYLIAAGSGSISTSSFNIHHRRSGTDGWTVVSIPSANGGGDLEGYSTGDVIEIRAQGVSSTGIEGPFTAVLTLTVGVDDANIPSALDDAGISITPLLGGALIQIATGDDTATAALQVYRSTSPVLDRETDATGQPLAVEPQSSYSTALGDTTRPNLVSGGTMTSSGAWTLGAGWAIAGGVAAHTAGTADGIAQSLVATAGKHYRIGFAVAGLTAGTLTPRLTGGSVRPGTSITENGIYSDRIQAVSGNGTLEFLANTEFDGTIDGVSAYLETSGCLAQGTHFIWIEPQNADGLPGPISGPFQLNII